MSVLALLTKEEQKFCQEIEQLAIQFKQDKLTETELRYSIDLFRFAPAKVVAKKPYILSYRVRWCVVVTVLSKERTAVKDYAVCIFRNQGLGFVADYLKNVLLLADYEEEHFLPHVFAILKNATDSLTYKHVVAVLEHNVFCGAYDHFRVIELAHMTARRDFC